MENIIEKMEHDAPDYIAFYIDWYMRANDENRESFSTMAKDSGLKEFYDEKGKLITEKYAERNWLTREDSQNCIQQYMKNNKTLISQKIYAEMVKKSLAGDVRAATWINQFHDSDFFDESQDEINDFLNTVNIPKFNKRRSKNTKE